MLLLGTGAAAVGLALVNTLGVTPTSSVLAVLTTLALLRLARLTFPPALGLALLPFVIPHPPLNSWLFTIVGSLWLMLVVAVMGAPKWQGCPGSMKPWRWRSGP